MRPLNLAQESLFAVHVDLEVLVVDLLVGSVGADGLDGAVEFGLQGGVALAQREAGAGTEVLGMNNSGPTVP